MSPAAPRQVLLFSGHMIDVPGRAPARFPASLAPAAAARIGAALDALDAGPDDLAVTQGAAGGDLLFAQACHERGVRVQLMLPLREPEFIARSILPSTQGTLWRDRYLALRAALPDRPREADDELGPLAPGADAFARANRWMLDTALAMGAQRLRFIALWDGGGGDGPGGTAHMIDEVRRRGGQVLHIDTRTLRPAMR